MITVIPAPHKDDTYELRRAYGRYQVSIWEFTHDELRELFHAINDASGGCLAAELAVTDKEA